MAYLQAYEGRSTFGESIELILRCKDGYGALWIDWASYLGSDNPKVTWRIDDSSPRSTKWGISTDSTATFYEGRNVAGTPLGVFIQQLVAADRFVAQVTPYNENPVTAVFALTGMEETALQVFAECPPYPSP